MRQLDTALRLDAGMDTLDLGQALIAFRCLQLDILVARRESGCWARRHGPVTDVKIRQSIREGGEQYALVCANSVSDFVLFGRRTSPGRRSGKESF